MGKRKTARKPVKKVKAKLDVVFTCVFCHEEEAIKINIKRNVYGRNGHASLSCKSCNVSWETEIEPMREPIDVYATWIDAVYADNNGVPHEVPSNIPSIGRHMNLNDSQQQQQSHKKKKHSKLSSKSNHHDDEDEDNNNEDEGEDITNKDMFGSDSENEDKPHNYDNEEEEDDVEEDEDEILNNNKLERDGKRTLDISSDEDDKDNVHKPKRRGKLGIDSDDDDE